MGTIPKRFRLFTLAKSVGKAMPPSCAERKASDFDGSLIGDIKYLWAKI